MKKIKLFLTALLIGTLVSGCGAASGNGGIPTAEQIETAKSEMGDHINSLEVSLNGQVYQFPMELQSMLDAGWEMNVKSEPLPAFSVTTPIGLRKAKENATCSFTVENVTASEKALESLTLKSLTIEKSGNATLILPQGLTWESTVEDVVVAYSLTEEDVLGDETFIYMFLSNPDGNGQVRIDFDAETRTIKKVAYTA